MGRDLSIPQKAYLVPGDLVSCYCTMMVFLLIKCQCELGLETLCQSAFSSMFGNILSNNGWLCL